MMKKEGYTIGNADVSISLEKPKLKNYIPSMRSVLASILCTDIKNVSIKAGTNEGLGAVGEEKACIATAIVLLRKDD